MALVTLGSKAVGSVVKIKINGTAWEWLVVNQGNPSTSLYDSSCAGTWLLLKNIYVKRIWGTNSTSDVNDYANGGLNTYLNSTFYNLIDSTIRAQIKQVKIPYRPGSGDSETINSGANGMSCKVFVPSLYETGIDGGGTIAAPNIGVCLSYFSEGTTDEAKAKRIATLSGTADAWWTRTPYCQSSGTGKYRMKGISDTGGNTTPYTYYSGSSTYAGSGVRPCIILPTTLCVDDGGNVVVNTAPTVPPSLTVPTTIKGGTSIAISWGASTDAQGNLSGYILERQYNGGSWVQLYKGANRTYTDTITKGWESVAYRVKAYDSLNAASAYRTSSTVTVNNNTAPGTPASITVPETVRGGESITVSWGASTDAESNLSGYTLERSVDGGTWTQVYQGNSRSRTDAITKGWGTVAYRVKAYDSEGLESAYKTSATRTVINNTAPTISGSDGTLTVTGTQPPTYTYTVNDVDASDTLTVTEKVAASNGVTYTLRTFTATRETENSVQWNSYCWTSCPNGTHSLIITVSDGNGGTATRIMTFTRTVNCVSAARAVSTDAMPTKVLLSLYPSPAVLPSDCVIECYVTNNPFDDSPVWENYSTKLNRVVHTFANSTCMGGYGIGYKFRITKGAAQVEFDQAVLRFA
ncbi:hypothetical protein CE91St46_01760 [Eubacteriales bacterium]|nr:hypothetical protein CE91St46_01760 [Eubacteriales bacterium]GKH61706.1 hypothetical protein CE91St47_01750 [Eubacteriales bacterium]